MALLITHAALEWMRTSALHNQLNSSPAMSPLRHRSVFGAKSAQNSQLRKVRFSCQTSNVVPEPSNSLVFGRKRAPDARCALDSAGKFHPAELVTVRHRFVAARFWVEKVRKSGPVPERRVFRGTTASRGPASERGSPPRFRLVTR